VSKPLPVSDFRAVRIVLEPDDFAVSSGKPDIPTDLIDKEIWDGIMVLPDDVSVRTSNHQGQFLGALYRLQATWTRSAIGGDQDMLHEVALYSIDELDASLFNMLHGYYRQAVGCLRNILELIVFGTYCQLANRQSAFEDWSAGQSKTSFRAACNQLAALATAQDLNTYLHETFQDSLIVLLKGTAITKDGGWVQRLYAELCDYSHSRPKATNVGLWRSNGPIYVPGSFSLTASLYCDTVASCYLLIKLARPSLKLPEEVVTLFKSYEKNEKFVYEAYRYLFSKWPE
jgi:hypothetical protein